MGRTRVASFFYADDIAIVADNAGHLSKMLEVCEQFSQDRGFRFSPAKCVCDCLTTRSGTGGKQLYGTPLARNDSFIYLGITMSVKGVDGLGHVTRMALKTCDAANLMRSIGANGHGFGTAAKKRHYETFVRPRLEYGLQLLGPNKAVLHVLEKAQHYALTTMYV